MTQKNEEMVLVVPAPAISALAGCQGYHDQNNQQKVDFILAHHCYRKRGEVEQDPTLKQIIPYVMVTHGDRFLLFRRSTQQDEKRLHSKYSLGAGGHINQEHRLPGESVIDAARRRELGEEVTVMGHNRVTLIASINDNSNSVGQVHLGLVYLLETDSPQFQVNEPDKMTATYKTVAELAALYEGMEAWSQILFDHFIQGRRRADGDHP